MSRCAIWVLPLLLLAPVLSFGQEVRQESDDFVEWNTRKGEPINLQALITLLQQDQNLQIVYDPADFPEDNQILFFGDVKVRTGEQFFQFVQLILRNGGYAIVKSEIENIHQIVPLANVRPFTEKRQGGSDLASGLGKGEYVTGIFPLEHITPAEAESYLNQFVLQSVIKRDQNNNNTSSIDGIILKLPPNLLIITELTSRILKIKEALNVIDVPRSTIKTEFIDVKNLEASALENQLESILELQNTARGATGENSEESLALANFRNVQISSDSRTNRLILIGSQIAIDRVKNLIEKLDQNLKLTVQTFQFDHISAERVDAIIRQSLPQDDEQLARLYQSSINSATRTLIVTARDDILQRIAEIKTQLDVPESESQESSPVEFYKLKHVDANDLLDTLQRVVGQTTAASANADGISTNGINTTVGIRSRDGQAPNGLNAPDANREGQLQAPPFVQQPDQGSANAQLGPFVQNPGNQLPGQLFQDRFGQFGGIVLPQNVLPGEAQITVDENTNTLIVVAEPAVQALYRDLIEKLDVYRPQVMVEVTVVTLTADEDFTLGIEVSGGDRSGVDRVFAFNSFGLSEVDAATGGLAITPGLGFNGTLVNPDVADVVLRALAEHSRARVVSAPRILVNDNANGTLSSVAEVPFSSINASNTVATTSFAGFATAGTTITVTPQISEGDYLNLDFDVLVNSFTGAGADGLPPPRTTDQVVSQVSIPNGHTVIVGGLTSQIQSSDEQRIPFLEDIPVFELLAGNTTKADFKQRLFVFIKPTILKDDKFKDLRYVSDIAKREAEVRNDFPKSTPLLVR